VKGAGGDSEHNAIFQCYERARMPGERAPASSSRERRAVPQMAGGEPRRGHAEQALKHPTVEMGAKDPVDSATLIHKGLEMIEARWAIRCGDGAVEVIVHPQSIVQSIGSSSRQLVARASLGHGYVLPIQYCRHLAGTVTHYAAAARFPPSWPNWNSRRRG